MTTRTRLLTAVLVFMLGLASCQNQTAEGIPTPRYAPERWGNYANWSEAQDHHCTDEEIGFHAGFWELAYRSAYQAVGNFYVGRYLSVDGTIVDGFYLDPANIEAVVVRGNGSKFGSLRSGTRILTLYLHVWVTNPHPPQDLPQSSPLLPGTPATSGSIQPDDVSSGAIPVRHTAQGRMVDETCEITVWNSW